MRVSEVLAQALAVYKLMPGKRAFAKNAQGDSVQPAADDACEVCSLGAVARVEKRDSDRVWDSPAALLLDITARQLSKERNLLNAAWTESAPPVFKGTAGLNDQHPELVEEMFIRAINTAKLQEKADGVCAV